VGNQSLARSGRETKPEHHGCPACYEGVVYVGYIVQDDHGEEHETYLALPAKEGTMTNTNGSFADLLRVALYLGVSTDEQAKHGYSDQHRALRRQAIPLPPVQTPVRQRPGRVRRYGHLSKRYRQPLR
jgi:hypothetical protein